MAKIRLERISKRFGSTIVLRDISLEIAESEFVAFVGPSGSGKSTLLRMIAGFESPSEGNVYIDDFRMNDVRPSDRGIAMVFQNYALYPHMTVAENISFGLKNLKVKQTEINRRVHDVAELLQITSLLGRRPSQLSGGQRQRVAIGRAIVHDPKVFLFDEPLSNLDAALRLQLRIELARLHRHFTSPMIYVTHDQVEAMTLADRIALMNLGIIEQIGPPLELYQKPVNVFVAKFFGSPPMNLVRAELVQASLSEAQFRLKTGVMIRAAVSASNLAPSSNVILGVRPEHLKVLPSSSKNAWNARVSWVENLGNRSLVYLDQDKSTQIVAEVGEDTLHLRRGESVELHAESNRFHVFGSSGRALPQVRELPSRGKNHEMATL